MRLSKTLHQQIVQFVVPTLVIAFLWVLSYKLSLWIFSFFEFNHVIFWIFLPAGVRMLAVLLFGWVGVLGLFIGAIITIDTEFGYYVFILSAISSLSPMLAMKLSKWALNIPPTLNGIKPSQLLIIAFASAIFNAIASNVHFHFSVMAIGLHGVFPMFVGDFLGTIIILYFSMAMLGIMPAAKHPPQ